MAAGVAGADVTPKQIEHMQTLVREAMESGVLGMSTGLEYGAGREARTAEVVHLARIVGEYDGYYASHIGNRDAGLQAAVDEFITIARQGGTHAEISHLNVRFNTGAAEGAWQRSADSVARARRDCDRYWRFIHRGEWERVRLQSSLQFPELAGKTFVEISEAMDKDAWDCYFDIRAEHYRPGSGEPS